MISPLKPGDTLRGRYRVGRIIGQGGMGCIYLADDLRLEGRQCALKEVEHDKTWSKKPVSSFYGKPRFWPVLTTLTFPRYQIISRSV